jgi:ubiquinone/menaquinone biosynthesis C-methylase UbiE
MASLGLSISEENYDTVVTGTLNCRHCDLLYPIINCIPRFSKASEYADTFDRQWNSFATVQIDNVSFKESAYRFKTEMGWGPDLIKDKSVIEIGCGAGRFLDIVRRSGAQLIVGVDITGAVEAAHRNVGESANVLIVQADVYALPFEKNTFDMAYSIGVLHHTPKPEAAFDHMAIQVREEGYIGVSLYENSLYDRPDRNSIKVATIELFWALNIWRCELFRTITTKIPERYAITYCRTVIPFLHKLNKVPMLRWLRYLLPSTCYRNLPVEWSMVDTMDTYSTKIVHQYRAKTIFQWFLKYGFSDITLMNGRAGWVSITANTGKEQTRAKKIKILEKPRSIDP